MLKSPWRSHRHVCVPILLYSYICPDLNPPPPFRRGVVVYVGDLRPSVSTERQVRFAHSIRWRLPPIIQIGNIAHISAICADLYISCAVCECAPYRRNRNKSEIIAGWVMFRWGWCSKVRGDRIVMCAFLYFYIPISAPISTPRPPFGGVLLFMLAGQQRRSMPSAINLSQNCQANKLQII